MKKFILILIVIISYTTNAQVTLIPDNRFEQRLINLNIDSDGIINGQILTTDAHSITDLNLRSIGASNLNGLEDFVNLEKLNCFYNPINGYDGLPYGTINVSTMLNLKELDVRDTHISTIDVSENISLEKISIGNTWGDVAIVNEFTMLDLSNNPNINYVDASYLYKFTFLNMRNNSADSVYIIVSTNLQNVPTVCIEVNDPIAATNGTAPYDNWVIDGSYFFNDNCTLSLEKFVNNNFAIYPNPATHIVTLEQKVTDGVHLQGIQILDSTGKWLRTVKNNYEAIDVSNLSKGLYYFIIQTDKGNKTEKVIIH